MSEKTYNFRTNTLLKNLVGKDLINDDKIAVIELVKNSIDANANQIIIEFLNYSSGSETSNKQIIIKDNGVGMDITDIRDKWLNIAFSDKKYQNPENRPFFAGNKGIGRFSCDRLGKILDLITQKKGGEILHLHINWEDFEKEGYKDLTIQEIPITVNIIKKENMPFLFQNSLFPEGGTTLIISKLRNNWDLNSLKKLRTSLEKFINPNQIFLKNQINISLSVPDIEIEEKDKDYHERITGKIINQIFEKLKFNTTYIESRISSTGDTVLTTLWHQGDKVFELEEKNIAYYLLPNTYTIIYYLNPYKKAYFKRQTGVRANSFGSIFLFLNGFRIPPYGDAGNDWLKIDARKQQGTKRYLGSRDIIGRIEITGNEEHFKPVSSREGLKETPEFTQLKNKYFVDVLRKLEKFVVEDLQWDSVPDHIRKELRNEDGINWETTKEEYKESWDKKKQRTVTSLIALIGSSPENIIKFWFNPSLLEGLYETKREDVIDLLSQIKNIDPKNIDANLLMNLSNINNYILQKDEETKIARSEAADLRVKVIEQKDMIEQLEEKSETYKAQTIFLRHVTSLDVERLIEFHHQIVLDTITVSNYLSKSLKTIKDDGNKFNISEYLQRALFITERISKIAQFATRANFRSETEKEPTDIPAYVEQYTMNVSKEYIAHDIVVNIDNDIHELFELNVSRIELSMLIDNIISNSYKAKATEILIKMYKIAKNTMQISFIDNGHGLSDKIPEINSIFEPGITTTTGSGLGLYHSKDIVKRMGGEIEAIDKRPNGFEIRVVLTR